MKQTARQAFIDTLPMLSAYVILGFGFGMLMKAYGFSVALAVFMSLVIYGGAMQYLAVGLLTGGASLATVALTSFMVQVRHLFYGLSMLEPYRQVPGWMRPYLIFALTDETYAQVCQGAPEDQAAWYYFLVSALDHFYWILGTLLGALAGSIYNFNAEGIDFTLTAMFLTIFLDQWLTKGQRGPQLLGLLASLVSLVIFGRDQFLIPAMVLIALALAFYPEEVSDD